MSSEIFSNINWLAVIVAGLAYFMLGAIWYSFIFKNAWLKAANVNVNDPNMKGGVAQIMLTSLILMIIASLGIALILSKISPQTTMTGVKVGLLAGLCFSVTGISISYLYEKRPLALHLINGAYNTVGCVIAGIILAVWK